MSLDLADSIQWHVHLRSPRETVFSILTSDEGRRSFWAESAPEKAGYIHFTFSNGMEFRSKVIDKRAPEVFSIEYFGGSRVQFELAEDGAGGTDLTMTETGVPEANRLHHLPGWIPVLLALKAAADFSVDLRNHDPERTWDHGYVDV
jgi:uncharacterized protein YndB with AHSA1/START domain